MYSSRRLFAHFVTTFIATLFVLVASLQIGIFVEDPAVSVPQRIIVVAFVHLFIVFVALNIRASTRLDVRINPYITTLEWLLNRPRLGKLASASTYVGPYMVELLAQVFAAVIASAFLFATLDAPLTNPVLVKSTGWTFAFEIGASLLVSWVYFHNYYHTESYQLPFTMASALGIMSGVMYPYHKTSTFNPFRALANCIPNGTCLNADAGLWILLVGPAVGMSLGYVLALVTRWNVVNKKK